MKLRAIASVVCLCAGMVRIGAADTDPIKFIPGSSLQIRAVSAALNYVGTPYKLGGTNEKGLDCSGLVFASMHELVPTALPRTTRDLFQEGKSIEQALLPGDLIFFDTAGGPSHVGIFSGEGHFIHAASEGPKTGVIVSSLSENYYRSRFLGARRVLSWSMPTFELRPARMKDTTVFSRKLLPETPLGFRFIPEDDWGSSWKITLSLNGETYLTKRMKLEKDSGAFIWIISQPGNWEISAQGENAKNAAKLSFSVEAVQ